MARSKFPRLRRLAQYSRHYGGRDREVETGRVELISLRPPPVAQNQSLSSTPGSSISQISTLDFLGRLSEDFGIKQLYQNLRDQLEGELKELDEADVVRWGEERQNFQDIIEHYANCLPHANNISYDIKRHRNKKIVLIASKHSGALAIIRRIGFHGIEVVEGFNGHYAKGRLSSPAEYAEAEFEGATSLGSRLRIYGRLREASTTIGGVILVNETPYWLTTGYAFSGGDIDPGIEAEDKGKKKSRSPWKSLPGRVVAHRYPQAVTTRSRMDFVTRALHSTEATDWALVELPSDFLPPNIVLEEKRDFLKQSSWAIEDGAGKLLIEKTVSEADLEKLRKKDRRVECFIFVSASTFVPGLIAPGRSTVVLDGAAFSVLRVDMDSELDYGDSGSWVLVGNGVCGVIIAGSSRVPGQKGSLPAAYMIPIVDIFDNISTTLSVKVSLPTLVDYRIDCLKARRQANGWISGVMPFSQMNLELLLAQKKERALGYPGTESLKLHMGFNSALINHLCFVKPTRLLRSSLRVIGLHHETIHRLILLGEICPLRGNLRSRMRLWVNDYRKSRLRNPRSLACIAIMEICGDTEGGENLFFLILFMWKTFGLKDRDRWIDWLVQLLSSLFAIMDVPKMHTPSTAQLWIFVRCVISAFKDEELTHLDLATDHSLNVSKPSIVPWLELSVASTSSESELEHSIHRTSSEPELEHSVHKPSIKPGPEHSAPRDSTEPESEHSAPRESTEPESEHSAPSTSSEPEPEHPMPSTLSEPKSKHTVYRPLSEPELEHSVNSPLGKSDSRGSNPVVDSALRVLVMLWNILQGDKSQIVVYGGQDASWVALYATALGLDVQHRKEYWRHPIDLHHAGPTRYYTYGHGTESALSDVIVYDTNLAAGAEISKLPRRERTALRQPGEHSPWSIDQQRTSSVAVGTLAVKTSTPLGAARFSTQRLLPLRTLYAFPIEMPLKSKHLLQYFSEVALAPGRLPRNSISDSIASAINDPCGLRNVLMIAAFRHAWKFSHLGTFEQTFLYHKFQTIRLVNAQLRPSQFITFCADHITTLCFAECTLGNFDAAETHLKGMMLYMETRDSEPKDQRQVVTHELCDRYFILAYNMTQCLKSRLDDYLASPAGARYRCRSHLSSQDLERLVPEWHSYEANGAGLCLDAMSVFPSFFGSSAVHEKLNLVDASRIITCVKDITRIFDMRNSFQRVNSYDTSPYELWDQGDPSRLFTAVVEAHIESCSPMPEPFDGSSIQSSWIGISVATGMYLNSILGVWNHGQPEDDQLLYYILRYSHRDLTRHLSESMSYSSVPHDLWFWKLFVTAFHLAYARINRYNAWMDNVSSDLTGLIRVWAEETSTRSWQDARNKLARIVWPANFDKEGLAESIWDKALEL
ncbi:hypothetical protein NM208_g4458 [Fusarium decemcellulare]|uniref:Uncharacterized protein n=1 Tax=Fusarium decemcellulare TaxID=57161 RepID=A0ACC1SKR1_9HYPO|nr:hypothetical protein NM208_g4458 [Fusarium decemcellulare]